MNNDCVSKVISLMKFIVDNYLQCSSSNTAWEKSGRSKKSEEISRLGMLGLLLLLPPRVMEYAHLNTEIFLSRHTKLTHHIYILVTHKLKN